MEIKFEWNEKKNKINQKKHGVSFEDAAVVFNDKKRLEMYDKKHGLFEERWTVVGLNGTTTLRVNFTERKGIIRIISARKASKKEEEKYFYGHGTLYFN
jgi:hypothetical protein